MEASGGNLRKNHINNNKAYQLQKMYNIPNV
jgi:hypothetical protein